MSEQKWPDLIWIVRHGQSAGNVAHDVAHAAGSTIIEIAAERDMDVPLSDLGQRQAGAVGRWFGDLPPETRPTVVLASPYLRAHDTARRLVEEARLNLDKSCFIVDERLREREFGILDRLTRLGIEQLYPDQAKMRKALGKFYYRPPGGESWCDVLLRLRNVLDTLSREYRQERVLIVCHTVVVLCFRYLLEGLDEAQILKIDRETEIANCGVTSYKYASEPDRLSLNLFNFVAPLEEAGETVTRKPDVAIAPK